jgi:hypothetical protein
MLSEHMPSIPSSEVACETHTVPPNGRGSRWLGPRIVDPVPYGDVMLRCLCEQEERWTIVIRFHRNLNASMTDLAASTQSGSRRFLSRPASSCLRRSTTASTMRLRTHPISRSAWRGRPSRHTTRSGSPTPEVPDRVADAEVRHR